MPAKVPEVIQCNAATFAYELESITETIAQPETEDSWDTIGRSIQRWTALVKGGAPSYELVAALRLHCRPIIRSITSERTILSGHAIHLIEQTAVAIGTDFEPLCPFYIPILFSLCARTIKLYITRAKSCLSTIVDEARPLFIISQIRSSVDNKSISLRLAAVELTVTCLHSFNPADLAKDTRAQTIEAIIKVTASDANPDVRKESRKAYDAYTAVLPDRVPDFLRPLSPLTRKYLGIKSSEASSKPSSRPQSSMSRPISRAEPSRGLHGSTTSRSHPQQHARMPSSNSMPSTRESARSPPLIAPKALPAHPVTHAVARRVDNATAASGMDDDHVRSNSLRGGAFNSGASGDRPVVRGPARVVSSTVGSKEPEPASERPAVAKARRVVPPSAPSRSNGRQPEAAVVTPPPKTAPAQPAVQADAVIPVAEADPTTPVVDGSFTAPASQTDSAISEGEPNPANPVTPLSEPDPARPTEDMASETDIATPKIHHEHEEQKPVPEPTRPAKPTVQRVATNPVVSRPLQPAPTAPVRARTASTLKPAESVLGPRRMTPQEKNGGPSNSKSSGPARAPVPRQPSRTILDRPPSAASTNARAAVQGSSNTASSSSAQSGLKAGPASQASKQPAPAPRTQPDPLKKSVRDKPAGGGKAAEPSKSAVVSKLASSSKPVAAKPTAVKPAASNQRNTSVQKPAEAAAKPPIRTQTARSASASVLKPAPASKPAPPSKVAPALSDTRGKAPASRDLTRPTASQLARSQSSAPVRKEPKKEDKPKSTWGRPPSAPVRKARPPPAKSTTKAGPPPRVRPEAVPLPSSPLLKAKKATVKAVKKAAAVPLPPSPGLQASLEEADDAVPSLELDEAVNAPVSVAEPQATSEGPPTPELALSIEEPVAPYPQEATLEDIVAAAEDDAEDDDEDDMEEDSDEDVEEAREDDSEDDLEDNIRVGIYPLDEPTVKVVADLANLQASEEDDPAFSDDDDDTMNARGEQIHIRVDTEGEDMQFSDVVEHGRSMSDESTMHQPLMPHTPAMRAPLRSPVPPTPISALLSSIQDGFHMPLSPPQAHVERAQAMSLDAPAAIPLSFSSANLMASQSLRVVNPGPTVFGAKGAHVQEDPQGDRGVLTQKQL